MLGFGWRGVYVATVSHRKGAWLTRNRKNLIGVPAALASADRDPELHFAHTCLQSPALDEPASVIPTQIDGCDLMTIRAHAHGGASSEKGSADGKQQHRYGEEIKDLVQEHGVGP